MIVVEVYAERNDQDEVIFINDPEVADISLDECLRREDFDYLEEAIFNINTNKLNLEPDAWYRVFLKRMYEPDRAGAPTQMWFKLEMVMKIEILFIDHNKKAYE